MPQRFARVTTPLGADILWLTGFEGTERLSTLFGFKLFLVAENKNKAKVEFDKLLGKELTVECDLLVDDATESNCAHRYFSGICTRFSQGHQDDEFIGFQAEIVPKFWFLTRQTHSRIFQQISVPDILKKVLLNLDVEYNIEGTFEKREYCVQYRETDFHFACRLMEEEGIYYFFKHTKTGHKLVVANSRTHLAIEKPVTIEYDTAEGGVRRNAHVFGWSKLQELRSGKYTLWDNSFQLPDKNLEAVKLTLDSVAAGKVTHKLKVGGNESFELYDYPGGYAQRFDGVNKSGGEQAAELQKIFQDNQRTVAIRMETETTPALLIQGGSNCIHFVSGHKFSLQRHFDADGEYILTSVQHDAKVGIGFRSGEKDSFTYSNQFSCIPSRLPFRPPQITPKPVVKGVQTATVVGPAGEEILTDKYGRVKVQFHWDREGKKDADSSCWLRVATLWAGKQWGMIHLPRIDQEVIVDFLEGDPDAPIIVGSVYSPKTMPPYKLPDNKTQSGVRSRSTKSGGPDNFNEIRFEDKKGAEQVFINAEKDMDLRVENDSREFIGKDQHVIVKANRKEVITTDLHSEVKGNRNEKVASKLSIDVGTSREAKIGMKEAVDAGMEIHLKAGMKVVIEAGVQLSLKVGGNFIDISPAGVTIQGTLVMINSGGAAGAGGGASPTAPQPPDTADDGTKATKLA